MIFDTHIHTEFSADSTMRLEAALLKAQEMQIGLITTEHMDFGYPEQGEFLLDIEQYFATYQPYRSQNFLLGIELGMQTSFAAENQKIAESAAFDYVLGSVHLVEEMDLYYDVFYQGRSKTEAYTMYFQGMHDCIEEHPFIDALGHIDYIARYAKYSDPEIYYHEFSDLIDVVLAKTIEQRIVLELNTRRLGERSVVAALLPIYQRYYELGGRMVTLGSDAHRATEIGGNFAIAMDFISSCHLRAVYFQDRQMQYMC